jgi:succinyl-CoA synthetase beta subunit
VFLIEHHGKELMASQGIPVPAGVFVPAGGDVLACAPPDGPVMVKAQVASGGRGKAGGVESAASRDDAARIVAKLDGVLLNGKPIHGFRIEQRVDFVHEAYVSLSVDGETARIRLLVSAAGGVDVEARAADQSGTLTALAEPENLADAAVSLCAGLPSPLRAVLTDAVPRLADVFLRHEATLLEVNPLFILRDGSWIAGDVKLVIDENAIVRQPAIAALLERHPDIYPESERKLVHGFDYVEVDPRGEIGLITTGAGLSMQLIDELKAQGRRPLNFCDIRSGQFRGNPARLIAVMQWIASRPSVRVVLVNIFAGITDLAEFARLLAQAAGEVPELRVPIVARLIGRNLDDARRILDDSNLAVTLEPDLDRALALTLAKLDAKGGSRG